MPWTLASADKITRGTDLRGAVITFENADDPDNVLSEVKEYSYSDDQTAPKKKAFKEMLLGKGGTVSKPKGECKAWLNHLNAESQDKVEAL